MGMAVFEYLVFKNEEKDKDGKITDAAAVIVDRQTILAKDDKQVQLIASRAIPEAEMGNIDRITVVVRPF